MNLPEEYSRDLTPASVKSAVVKQAIQKPLLVYPAALTALGLLYGAVFDFGLIASLPIIGGAIMSSGSYVWDVFVKGAESANAYIQEYRLSLEAQLEQMLIALKQDLDTVGNKEGYRQVSLFQDKYNVFKGVLDKKLEVGELTYNRYLSIAEQVFLGGLDNIENAALAIKSVSAIDVDELRKSLSSLSDRDGDEIKKRELESRLALHDEQVQRAKNLLLENESALTQLDQVTTKIANINTKQQRAELDLEDAMSELRHLIARAENYSN